MMNFLLGTVAGGIIACVATIAAARHPDIQMRLGLVPPVQAALAPAPPNRAEARCVSAPKGSTEAGVGRPEMLFARRRFWSVAPWQKPEAETGMASTVTVNNAAAKSASANGASTMRETGP